MLFTCIKPSEEVIVGVTEFKALGVSPLGDMLHVSIAPAGYHIVKITASIG